MSITPHDWLSKEVGHTGLRSQRICVLDLLRCRIMFLSCTKSSASCHPSLERLWRQNLTCTAVDGERWVKVKLFIVLQWLREDWKVEQEGLQTFYECCNFQFGEKLRNSFNSGLCFLLPSGKYVDFISFWLYLI